MLFFTSNPENSGVSKILVNPQTFLLLLYPVRREDVHREILST